MLDLIDLENKISILLVLYVPIIIAMTKLFRKTFEPPKYEGTTVVPTRMYVVFNKSLPFINIVWGIVLTSAAYGFNANSVLIGVVLGMAAAGTYRTNNVLKE